ncbi:MAG TPA: LPS export ABC transporter permease LptG, partial [Moraxellaceae bacterium]|nr:LPS export ABC transporter permease LptG [Moraxellaceae bacterium]
MKQLSSYVTRTVLAAMLLTLVLLLGLEMLFGFIGGLEDVHGAYTAYEVLVYTVLTSPARAYELLPIAALVGGITGLGMMAGASELVVMRASGVSVGRIVWWVMRPALVLVVAGFVLGQFVVPRTGTEAELRRAQAHGYQIGARGNYWHREGSQMVHIGLVTPEGELGEVVFYRQRADGNLDGVVRAAQARYEEGNWQLQDVRETTFTADGASRVAYSSQRMWPSQLTPEFLRLVTLDPETLSLTDLRHYATYMKAQGLDSGSY